MLTYSEVSALDILNTTAEDYWYASTDCARHYAECQSVERELARVRWLSRPASMVESDARTRVGGGAL